MLAAKRQRLKQAEVDAAEAEGEFKRLSAAIATAEQVGPALGLLWGDFSCREHQ